MKTILGIAFVGMIVAGYLGYKSLTMGIQNRIGSLQNADIQLRDLKKELSSAEGCTNLFAAQGALDVAQLNQPDGKIPLILNLKDLEIKGAYLTNLVDLGPVGDLHSFQARLKLKNEVNVKEHVVSLVKITTGSDGKVKVCLSTSDAGFESGGSHCQADNSPDQMRPGAKANLVWAPEGTTAVSGKIAKPVFAFKGVVKWLPMPACGPVNYCQDGLWTTTSTIPCKD